MSRQPWIGVDLDGCLAVDIVGEKFDYKKIGPPVPKMVSYVRQLIMAGNRVKIFTARVCKLDHFTVHEGTPEEYAADVTKVIEDWCEEHIGVKLEVTCEKDYLMKILYDDRARQVIKDKGDIVGEPAV